MRITSGFGPFGGSYSRETSEGGELRQGEVVDDLFNNPIVESESKSEIKLRLSPSSRRLTANLRQEVEEYLGANRDLTAAFQEISLPENAYARRSLDDQAVRKMRAYVHWLNIHEQREEEPHESEAPYLAIHEQGHDEEMRTLLSSYEEKRQELKEARQKHAPSYYYQAYPEVYAFN